MSELKAIDVDKMADVRSLSGQFYRKSEADKVIAELKADYKEACDRLQTANLIKDEKLDELRHHKYKRCLATAMWCASRVVVWTTEGNERKADWYWKWKEKWKKLAEKFKEAK